MITARVLALDVGKVRIGVALTDALGLTAQPLLTIHRKSRGEDLRNIVRLAARHEATRILVGKPLHLSGDESTWSRKVQDFANELATRTDLPIELVDERLSTRAAHELLDESNYPRREKKGNHRPDSRRDHPPNLDASAPTPDGLTTNDYHKMYRLRS